MSQYMVMEFVAVIFFFVIYDFRGQGEKNIFSGDDRLNSDDDHRVTLKIMSIACHDPQKYFIYCLFFGHIFLTFIQVRAI